MKPLRLEMENFGPYEKQIIDFESFEESPLFLISGKTGSGKTTLFDAMCFALFGKTSGMDRQPEQMRSDFAEATEVTSVRLKLEHHGKIYSIMRQPKQFLAKKRGKGIRESNTKVELAFKMDDGKEKVLTKVSAVNLFLKDLLHLTAEQFTQIILLPQGKFRRFLTANSNDKENLLRELFGTFFYRQWSEDVQKRAKKVIRANEEQDQAIKTLQSQIKGLENRDIGQWLTEMNGRISDEELKVQKGNLDVKQQEEVIEKMVSDYHEKCQLHEDLIKIKELKKRHDSFNTQVVHINNLREKLLKLEWVEKNKDLFSSLDHSQHKSIKLEKMIDDMQKKLFQSKKVSIEKKKEQASLQRDAEKTNKLRVSLMKGKEQAELFKRVSVWSAKLTKSATKLHEESKKLENAQNECISIEETIKKEEEKLKKRETVNTGEVLLQQETTKLAERQKHLEDLDEIHAELLRKEAELFTLKNNLEKSNINYKCAQNLYTQLANDFALTQIQRLSQHLKPDTPCPVCGSRNHPLPAKVDETKEIAESEVEEAEENAKKSAGIYHSYKGEYQAKKNQYSIEETKYQEQSKRTIKEIIGFSEVEGGLAAVTSKLEQQRRDLLQQEKKLQNEQREIALATQKIKLMQKKKQQFQAEKEQAKINVHEFTIMYAQADTAVKQLTEQLPANFENLEELQINLKQQQTEISEYDAQVSEIQKEVERTTLEITAFETDIKNYRKQLEDEGKVKNQLSAKLELSIQNSGFKFEIDENFLRETLKELSKITEYRFEIKEYEERLLTIKTRIKQLTERTQNLEDPKLDEMEKKLTIEREKRDRLVDVVAKDKQIYYEDKSICERVSYLWNDQQRKLKELASWNQLAEVMNGKGKLKLSLERYVLRSYLSKVLLIANNHLARLSQGRYVFKLDRNNGTYATDTGLEINVFDDNSGKVRSVHTLSGGESFIAALALSLALGEVLQNVNGGANIEALFIDEGFGSLDEDALETALEALQTIEGSNRLFGIISHVGILRDKIPDQMRVLSNNGRSNIVYKHYF